MKRTSFLWGASAVAIGILLSAPASAATVSYSFSFEASKFSNDAPVEAVTGSFDITFDPTLTYINSTAGITMNSLDFDVGSDIAFEYQVPRSGGIGDIRIGGVENNVRGMGEKNDFALLIRDLDTSPFIGYFVYSLEGSEDYFSAEDLSLSVAPVPLPPAILLFAAGLGLFGIFGWRKGRHQTPS